ncbi:MAG: hypothetical protein QM831_23220 [Kofleriaceae bacterium]
MRRLLVLAVVVAGCGDNSEMCGTGTKRVDNVCVPSNDGITCGFGTVLDHASGTCMPDPTVCRDGTVLIDGTCQDPSANVAIDLEEAAEPNGFESNAHAAGIFTPKDAIGAGFVIHGCIKPDGNTPDVDVYQLSVTAPMLLDVTSAGVGGLVGGFEMLPGQDGLGEYTRIGVATMSQTAKREVFLPSAGTYEFVVADTRTLLTGQSAGDPNGTTCYYVTLTHEATPSPTPLSVPVGTNDTFDNGKLAFYSANLKNGFNLLAMSVADSDMVPALDVIVDGVYRPQLTAADAIIAGVPDGTSTLIVADYISNVSYLPVDYVVSFAAATTAQPLDGTSSTLVNGQIGDPANYTNQFYFDVLSEGDIYGLDITTTVPVRGLIWDQDKNVVGDFNNTGATWTHYRGLWKAHHAGRYYLALTAPSTPVNTMYSVTGVVERSGAGAILVDMPLIGQATSAYGENVYSTGSPWVSISANSTTTGNITVSIYDWAHLVGRIDPLAGSPGVTPAFTATLTPNGTPVNYVIGSAGGTTDGTILIVRPTNPTSTFDLSVANRTRTDFGSQVAPYSTTMGATAAGPYSIETAAGNRLTVTVHPTDGSNPRIRWLNADESTKHTFDTAGAGADEVATWGVEAGGVAAFVVENTAAYSITVTVAAPYYTAHVNRLTGLADACLDGLYTDINANHFSDPIDASNPFVFFGTTYSQFRISDYGYLTFDLATASASPVTAALPDGIGAKQIVVQGDTITSPEVCVADRGTQTAVQWRGTGANGQVEMQAIIDGASGTIEYQYTQNHHTAATSIAGVQASTGLEGVAATPAPITSIKFTHP